MAKYGQIVATGIPAGVSVIVKDSTGQQAVLYPEPNSNLPLRRGLTADTSGAIFPAVYALNGTYTVLWTGGSQSVTVSNADGEAPVSVYVDPATQAELNAVVAAASGTYVPLVKGNAARLSTGGIQTRLDPDLATALRVPSPITVPTGVGDASNNIVEPDIRYFPDGCPVGMDGKRYVLAGCPYPSADPSYENPSVWVSDDGNTWTVPTGVTNPIYANGVGGAGYGNNSDAAIILGPDNCWYYFWNQFTPSAGWAVRVGKSTDGVTWGAAQTAILTVLATSRPTCPTVLYDAKLGLYVMYALEKAVSAGQRLTLMRYTASDPMGTWTQSTAPTYTWPTPGRGPWHLNAYLIGEQHVLLIDDTVIDGSGPGHLFLAVSDDRGATFTVGKRPLLQTFGTGLWDSTGLYRSAMVPRERGDQLVFDLFYGAINASNVWQLGRSTLTFDRQRHGAAIASKVNTGKSMYYTSPGTAVGTAVIANGDPRATPIYFDRQVTLDRIGVEVTTFGDVAAVYRLGIYGDDGNGWPGALILDAGVTATMSANGLYEITINQTLPPGMYWLVGVPQLVTGTAPTVRIHTGGSGAPSVGSTTALTLTANTALGYRASTMTGALGTTFATTPTLSGTAPRVIVRVA